MQQIHFRGLPFPYRVGSAGLLPGARVENLLKPCCVCERVSVIHHLCASGHSFCPECLPPSNTARTWCLICRSYVDFTAETISGGELELMEFSCACRFTGSLRRIREHLLETETPQVCHGRAAGEAGNHLQGRAPLYGVLGETLHDLSCEVDQITRTLRAQRNMISRLRAVCDVPSDDRRILCFNFAPLFDGEFSEERVTVNGVPLSVQLVLGGLPGERYMFIYTAASSLNGGRLRIPIRKSITLSLLDMQGNDKMSAEILTYENGEYTDESFADPASNTPSRGILSFVSLSEVLRLYPEQDAEYLILAVTVKEIDT